MLPRLSRLVLHNTHRAPHRSFARIAALSGGLLLAAGYVHADSLDVDETKQSFRSLVRSYTVFSMCSVPGLVDYSPKILGALTSVPGLRQITEAFVRVTFFNHFVGGDTAEGTLPLLHAFRRANKGALLAYSVEVDPSTASASHSSKTAVPKEDLPHKRIIREMIHSIDVAADFEDSLNDGGRRTWVAVKITALVPNAQALINLSSYMVRSRLIAPDSVPFPGCPRATDLDVVLHPTDSTSPLSKEDTEDLRDLYQDLCRVCTHARERGVKVIIDAEWSWYQPAIDAVAYALMREFNSLRDPKSAVQPLVYTTYQAYLRRTPSHLALSLADARKNNYALGVKLVRGAYHPYEYAAHQSKGTSLSISPDELPPVWSKKEETDRCYNQCVRMLLNAVREDVQGDSSDTQATSVDGTSKQETHRSWSSWMTGYTSNSVSQLVQSSSSSTTARLPRIGVLFGTHNWESAKLILDELVQTGLAMPLPEEPSREEDGGIVVRVRPEAVERVAIAQLYGMSDDLTQYLTNRTRAATPFIIKYVPYGALEEVMPYLTRRALENKSILGDGKATHERQRAGKEIWKKLTRA